MCQCLGKEEFLGFMGKGLGLHTRTFLSLEPVATSELSGFHAIVRTLYSVIQSG